ncbi:hypothetical protein F4X73_06825 [Candidatus Poribacteria bacterium]|nr:hypothetical protein [Candidatus Poribacteria bacterium]MYB64386.1 hypothetical protein [Candidatus Poribacteria bacterium]MYF55254.1 hypothetical protein [Candidatus Poribacteria bacterium]
MTKIIPFLLIVPILFGCAAYNFETVEMNLNTGKSQEAYNYLKKNEPKKPDIPHKFELGLIAHYADLFPESSKAFEQAEMIAEDRFTKSLTKEGLSLFTTDKLRPYTGSKYERLIAHYYHALNYIYQDKIEDALVECRRATNLINYFKDSSDDYDFFGTGFIAYFSAIIFETAGEFNDAFISYRQAEQYYKSAAEKTGIPIPGDVGHSLVRITRKLRFTDEYEFYKRVYGEAPAQQDNHGELILFYETGYVPKKKQQSLTFPILKTDKFGEGDDEETIKFARTLRTREGLVVEEVKLEYLLRIAVPTIRSKRPYLQGIHVSVEDQTADGVLVEDIERNAIETFLDERPIILLRTLIRGLLKYLTFKQADKKNPIVGSLVNLAGAITESADTRSWQSLPNQIYMVRVQLPEGPHRLRLSFLNSDGQIGNSISVNDVVINANQITLLNFRTYE